ncbi:MAG: hypothetical protein NZ561_13490, partial [Phycisphaerae bacterium]|nr:hypothetical protein [Phycisphaerae bacterium]
MRRALVFCCFAWIVLRTADASGGASPIRMCESDHVAKPLVSDWLQSAATSQWLFADPPDRPP